MTTDIHLLPPSAIVAGLFDDLVAALHEAALSIREGRIEDRFRAIAVATEVVADLAAGLEGPATDDWSRRTSALYRYLNRLFLAANLRNDANAIDEAVMLVEPVRRAWQCMAAEEKLRAELARRGIDGNRSSVADWLESAAAD
ncbi:flagellar export chaperone FliS [Hyphomonas sp.]|jgi:flagellar protein FliS|uniref:flagellar export chaperone FliS n=1 Tax=Hyphomonas sp. TaxID=87 RepID=UPI0037BF6B86